MLLIHAAITGTNAQIKVSLGSPMNKPGTVPTIVLTVTVFFCNLQIKWPNDFMHFSTLLTCFLTPSLRYKIVYVTNLLYQ